MKSTIETLEFYEVRRLYPVKQSKKSLNQVQAFIFRQRN